MLETSNNRRPVNRNPSGQTGHINAARDAADAATASRAGQGQRAVKSVRVAHIEDNELQTRVFSSPEEEDDLGQSMETETQLQPIGVMPIGTGPDGQTRYRVLYGSRRLRSARRRGHEWIDAVIRDDIDPEDEEKQFEVITAENSQRKPLTVYETCRNIAIYKERFKRSFPYIAQHVRKEDGNKMSTSEAENRYYAWSYSDPERWDDAELKSGLRKMLEKHPETVSHIRYIYKYREHPELCRALFRLARNGAAVNTTMAEYAETWLKNNAPQPEPEQPALGLISESLGVQVGFNADPDYTPRLNGEKLSQPVARTVPRTTPLFNAPNPTPRPPATIPAERIPAILSTAANDLGKLRQVVVLDLQTSSWADEIRREMRRNCQDSIKALQAILDALGGPIASDYDED